MAEYKKQIRSGDSRSRSFNNKSNYSPKERYQAECNSCRQRCEVPFRPNGKKPVYCSDCFTKNDSRGERRPSFAPRPHHEQSSSSSVSDRQIQELKKEIQSMQSTLQDLVVAVDTFNRATALTKEIQKYLPVEKPAAKKVVTVKKEVSKPTTKKTKTSKPRAA